MLRITKMNLLVICSFLFLSISNCDSQDENPPKIKSNEKINGVVGGPFENGDFMYINLPEELTSIDTSLGWKQVGQKLKIHGTIFRLDGKTPAPNVILYYYHTDINGLYSSNEKLDKRVSRHGYIRGWIQSDENGKYEIYTVRPAPYPNLKEPAHIHLSIKEPKIDKEYYIDSIVFEDDPLLTPSVIEKHPNRGGSGILKIEKENNLQIAKHNIILGLNIPNYPK